MNETNPPGNADLQIGVVEKNKVKSANREIGGPGGELSGNADLLIGGGEKAKSVNQEIGEPGGGAGGRGSYWHSRGYLPHFESAEKIQHVTFHLADSLPKAAVARLEEELLRLPTEQQDIERRKRIEAWRDAGYGACVLRNPVIAEMVQNTFFFFDGERYRLLAWVIMPNHVHVLFQPLPGWTVAKIVASWKKFTARKICDYQKANPGNANLQIGGAAQNTQSAIQENGEPGNGEPGNKPSPVWQREYWDRFIRDEKHLRQVVSYIHQNPVKAGLVVTAESWRWSSAYPGNVNLLISEAQTANQEIGDPGKTRQS